MLRFVLLPFIAVAVLLTSTEAAHAEVVVVRPDDTSSQVVVKTKPPTVVVVKHTPIPQAEVVKPCRLPKETANWGFTSTSVAPLVRRS